MRKIRGFKLGKQVVKFYGWFFPPKPIWVPPSLATDWQDQDNFSTLQLGSTSQNQGQKDMFVELGSGSFLWLPSGGAQVASPYDVGYRSSRACRRGSPSVRAKIKESDNMPRAIFHFSFYPPKASLYNPPSFEGGLLGWQKRNMPRLFWSSSTLVAVIKRSCCVYFQIYINNCPSTNPSGIVSSCRKGCGRGFNCYFGIITNDTTITIL
ncbi:hypothetical protein CK203_031324 [Vitis vinifera]|uniref:Uncharacterized protein n=1 Tax=Vitis vinifera TaxID=29760 RepID=A0A438IXG0_VITVI|nr:hypothetical protein CK203_031324 [Vitis vinifera]